jgi:hypothetical protein
MHPEKKATILKLAQGSFGSLFRGLLEKIWPTAARFPPKMAPLGERWVVFSSGRAMSPTVQ